MYERILVPTDGSDAAAAAADHAATIAERFDATLHALYAIETDAVAHGAPELPLESIRETLRDEGETATAAVESRAADRGVESTADVIDGAPETAILDAVADRDIDLVVMGTHGRRGGDTYRVGSVTDRVVGRVDVPVLVVHEA